MKKKARIIVYFLLVVGLSKTYLGKKEISRGKSRQLKIFVYDLPQLSNVQDTLRNSQFATENIIHQQMVHSPNTTSNANEADFFFVPLYSMGVVYKYKRANGAKKSELWNRVSSFVKDDLNITACQPRLKSPQWCTRMRYQAAVLNYAVSLLSFWNTPDKNGSRHIFVFPGGDQQKMFPNWSFVINNSIHLLVEGYYGNYTRRERGANNSKELGKDIIIPGGGDLNSLSEYMLSQSIERDIFMSYCGNFDSPERKAVKNIMSIIIKSGKKTILTEKCTRTQFIENMRRSLFCLTPAGSTPWTARLYSSIAFLCVPVLFNVNVFVPPFGYENIFNSLSVRLNVEDIVETKIKKIFENTYSEKYSNLVRYKSFFHLSKCRDALFYELLRRKAMRKSLKSI